MRPSRYGWYGAVVAATLSLGIGCDDAPASQEKSASPTAPTLRQQADNEARGPRIPFANLRLFFEFNSTDNDLGVQLMLDGEPWERVRAFDPGQRQIFEITALGRLEELGLTELFFESAEPSPGEVLALFPAGTYRFTGETLEDERLTGTARLSHDLPPAPVFSPSNGERVDRNNVVIRWRAIPRIAGYQVIVANEDIGVQMTVDLKPSVTSLQVPPTFLEAATEYDVEVLAIATNGNKTITEAKGAFVTKA
jgi:hypothetical protein